MVRRATLPPIEFALALPRRITLVRMTFALLLVASLAARTTNVNWDQGQHLHPDERFMSMVSADIHRPASVAQYFDSDTSPLNPYNRGPSYVYGTLPLFLNKAVSSWLGGDDPSARGIRGLIDLSGGSVTSSNGHLAFDDGYNSNLVGRVLSAIFDTLTVALVVVIGRRLGGVAVGLAAGAIYASAPLALQYSHFFGAEAPLTFLAAGTLYFCLRIADWGRWRDYLLAGICVGAATSCKVSGLPLALLIPLAGCLHHRSAIGAIAQRRLRPKPLALLTTSARWFASFGFAFVVFRLTNPYAFAGSSLLDVFRFDYSSADILSLSAWLRLELLHPTHYLALDPRFIRDFNELYRLQGGAEFPPNIQWIGRTPFIYPLTNLMVFGFGPFASLAFLVGLRVALTSARRGGVVWLIPIAWALADFVLIGGRFTAFMRYLLPIYPALAVVAGLGVVSCWRARRELTSRRQPLGPRLPRASGPALAVALLAGSVLLGIAFVNGVYARTNTRILASQWIQQNISTGAVISHTTWDDALPLILPGDPPNRYQAVDLTPFETDSRAKIVALVDALDRIDYVIESSNRAYASIPRNPARYPSTIRYYDSLWNGDLGFEKVADFESPMEILGLRIPDRAAEEAFTVYDHPRVTIWKKTPKYSRARALSILQPERADSAVFAPPSDAGKNQLILTPSEYATQQSGGTWTSVFSTSGVFTHLPWLWWLAWLELLSFAALPLATLLLRSLPDRGYGASKVIGPGAATLVCWALVAWGFADFSRSVAWLSFSAMVAGGASIGAGQRRHILESARKRWRTWLVCELVFLGTFAGFLLLRAWNPSVWYHPTGGEKPMDLAYLTAVTRSTTFPPYDPWFAGGYMNYYYMGWMVLAVPMRAFQTVPEIAFNLAAPTFAAMAAAVTFGTCVNLTAMRSKAERIAPRPSVALVGLLGVALFLVAGNFDALHQQIEHLQKVSDWRFQSHVPLLGGAIRLAGGLVAWIGGTGLAPFDWWRSSRVHFGTGDITEFPFWTLLFSDVHPHLMDLPFFGLSVALGLGYIAARLDDSPRVQFSLACILGLSIGFVRAVHTWDFPTAVLLGLAAIGVGTWLSRDLPKRRWAVLLLHIAGFGFALVVPFLPFTAHLAVPNQGLERAPFTTPIQQTFDHWGVFLVVTVIFLVVRYREERSSGNVIGAVAGDWFGLSVLFLLACALYVVFDRHGVATVAVLAFVLVLIGNLALIDLHRRQKEDLGRLVATLLIFVAFAIVLGTDVVRVVDDIDRMNTVFKFSLQAWQLAAIGGASATAYILRALWDRQWRETHLGSFRLGTALAATGVFASIGSAALLYPILATPQRQEARFVDTTRTLDGLVFLKQGDPTFLEERGDPGPADDYRLHLNEDLPLIEWLRANVQGTPTIVEEVGPLYHWTGRFSEYTGLPAVIGWDWHQVQQRGQFSAPVAIRRKEVAGFYRSSNAIDAARFLRRYDAAYVMVSAWERALGDEAAFRMFESLPGLEPVFRSGENVIYRVHPDELNID